MHVVYVDIMHHCISETQGLLHSMASVVIFFHQITQVFRIAFVYLLPR